MSISNFLNSSFLGKYFKIYRENGLKALIKQGGWKMGFLIFMFFLLKGILWILVPYLLAKGFFS